MFPNILGRPLLHPGGSRGSCFNGMRAPPSGKDLEVLKHFCNSWQHFIICYRKHKRTAVSASSHAGRVVGELLGAAADDLIGGAALAFKRECCTYHP